jgi:hypothetical protein
MSFLLTLNYFAQNVYMRTRIIKKLISVPILALGITGASSTSVLAVTCSEPVITIGSGETCSNTRILNQTTISNSGTMNDVGGISTILNISVITNLTNFSVITNLLNLGGPALQNGTSTDPGTINLLNNFGSMTGANRTIDNVKGSIETLNNYNSITSTGGNAIHNDASIGLINNTFGSLITGLDSGIYNNSSANISNIINAGSIRGADAIGNAGTITNLINSGTISNTSRAGIYNVSGSITTLTNSVGGVISGSGSRGAVFNHPTASIITFNNAQGGDTLTASKTAIVYNGKLPTNYNIIIASPTNYGQLAWTNQNSGGAAAGSTNFGIYEGSLITSRLYTGVLQGLADGNVGATTGSYDGMS